MLNYIQAFQRHRSNLERKKKHTHTAPNYWLILDSIISTNISSAKIIIYTVSVAPCNIQLFIVCNVTFIPIYDIIIIADRIKQLLWGFIYIA